MIVKCQAAKLKPGMYVSNPGLSQLSNPHVYLDDVLIEDSSQINKISEKYFDTYIDTEKGTYFINNEVEKEELESAYSSFPAVGDENNVRSKLDDVLSKIDSASEAYNEIVSQYKELSNKMMIAKSADLDACENIANFFVDAKHEMLVALLLVSRMKFSDQYTYTHSLNVSILSVMLARQQQLSEEEQKIYGMAGIFHDIGKILIPAKILKKPGKLTASEFAEIKKHPVYAKDILSIQNDIPQDIIGVAYEHHEHYDGSGYPQGISGDKINKAASLVSIIDTFDALRSDRYYREAISSHKAICVIYGLKGKVFDPVLVDKFIKMVGIYPVGSIVVLKCGKKAVVTDQNSHNLLRPKVRVILDDRNNYCKQKDFDLSDEDPEGPYAISDTVTNKECRVHILSLVH